MGARIYYTDPYCLEFDATVTAVTAVEPGSHAAGDAAGNPAGGPASAPRWRVRLDRTAFYPTTGGQPFDTGTLDRVRVVDVVDADGEVDHLTDAPLTLGATVKGTIDRDRRIDHMQQHTGQHLLSAAFDRLWKARTESFHLGTASATIDLAREVTPIEIARAEEEANRIVWEDRPVTIRFVSAEEAAALPLRKEPQRGGELRVIDVDQFDLSACGGTHVARTGEIGVIAVRGWERFKGGMRVEFVCGGRALRSFRELRDVVNGSVRLLSVLPGELPSAIERAQAESKDLRRQMKDLTQRLAIHEAATLAARATPIGPASTGSAPVGSAPIGSAPIEPAPIGRALLRGVIEAIDGYDAAGLKTLATTIAAQPGHVAALVSSTTPALVVIARSSDVSLDASAVLEGLMATFGGKGGGRADLAQGGGLSGTSDAIVAALRALIADR